MMLKDFTLKRIGLSLTLVGGVGLAIAGITTLSPASPFNNGKAKVTKMETASAGTAYLLVGKSYFNEEGDNVYLLGGEMRSFPVKVHFNDETKKVAIENLATGTAYAQMGGTAVLDWDSETKTISAQTPQNFFSPEQSVCMIEFEGAALTLNAGEMYGMGYWRYLPELTMDVKSDLSVIHSQNAFGIIENLYDVDREMYYPTGIAAGMFDVNMYRMGEGPLVYSSISNIDFGGCGTGNTSTQKFILVNSGDEDADFAVSLKDACFKAGSNYGVIPAGEWVEFEVSFSPVEATEYSGTLKIMGEQNVVSIPLTGYGKELPNYSLIVKEGLDLMTFNADNTYPFEISEEYGDSPVAVSSNKHVSESESWMEVSFNVPEGKRATLTTEGFFYPYYAAYDYLMITEGAKVLFESDDTKQHFEEFSYNFSFIPGDHTVRICYEKGNERIVPSVTMGEDYTYISGLSLVMTDYLAQEAALDNETYEFGKFYTMDPTQEIGIVRESVVNLKNLGYESLTIAPQTTTDHFGIFAGTESIAPDNSAPLTVAFRAALPGIYTEDIPIQTSAGEIMLTLTANLLAAPDYQSIVKQGDFTFEMGMIPFQVKDGRMFNDPSEAKTGEKVVSEISARFNVPEGKCGLLTWDGYADLGDGDDAMIMIDQKIFQAIRFKDKANASCFAAKPTDCYLAPGEHLISFGFTSCGSSKYDGENILSISDLSLEILDEIPEVVIWEPLPIEFKPVFPGHSDRRALTLWNVDYTKTNTVAVENVSTTEGFGTTFSGEVSIYPLQSQDIVITFDPAEAGLTEGSITVSTANGSLEIPVCGEGKDDSRLLFYEDFEGTLDAWTIYEADNDKNTWKLAPASMAYMGISALQFNSSWADGTSEDYIVSPEIEIPVAGATLSFFRAYNMSNGNINDYYVAVGNGEDFASYEPVFTEDVFSKEYQEMTVNLDAYAGQTIRICFANVSTPEHKNILKIDEVTVIGGDPVSVKGLPSKPAVNTEYYTLDGVKIAKPSKGIYIVRQTLADGRVKTFKKTVM